MTKEAAIAAMEEGGYKVAHRFFGDNEYIAACDDEHYSNKIANADQKLVDRIKKQLTEGIKKTKTFNCWKCDEIFNAKIIVGKTESVTCPCCGRENRVKKY